MGFFDSIFGPSETKTETEVKLPGFMERGAKKNYEIATKIASQPYTPYPFERIAGFSGDQQAAMGMLRGLVGSSYGQGTNLRLPRMIDDIGKGGDVEAYMDPYVDNVLDRTQTRIRQATDMAKQWQSNAGAHQEGAFGDARHGIADALIEERGIQQMGDAAAQGYSQAYSDAQNMRNLDINRLIEKARFDQGARAQLLQFIDSLYRSGSNQQQLDQRSLDMGYQDFINQRDYPIERLNLLISALQQTPYGQTTTNSQPGPSVAGQITGGIGALLSAFL